MKATRSKDGVMRYSVSVVVRIGRQEIIDCIGWNLVTYGHEFPTSKRAALKVVRDVRSKEGDSMWSWQEAEEATPAKWREVAACVDKLFPELS